MAAQLFLFPEARQPAPDADFDAFWQLYPHRVCKGQARRAWPGAVKKAGFAAIMTGLRNYMRDKPDDIPWCNPATFLNGERWADEPATRCRTQDGSNDDHRLRNLADMLRRGRNVGSVTPAMVREMVSRGWLTTDEARKAGF